MNKLLIGVCAPDQNLQARNAVRYFAEHLNAQHFNIEQQVIDAAACALRISPHEFVVNVDPQKKLPILNINAAELKQKIRAALCSSNPFFLIDSLHVNLNDDAKKHITKLFNGSIVSGITTHMEAEYIRSHGGLMIHIHNESSLQEPTIATRDDDLVIHTSNSNPLNEKTLQAFTIVIGSRFEPIHAKEVPEAA
jgi:hypothetical protein